MHYDVPFHPQKWDLSKWKEVGFDSEEDARYWERSCCGILCVQMASEYFLGQSFLTHDLIEKGINLNAYSDSTGWSHQGLVRLSNDLGLLAKADRYTPDQIVQSLEQGKLVIISIKWAFEKRKTPRERLLFWKKYGGHLALVVGFEKDDGKITGFYVHHTSIRKEYNWQTKFIAIKDFKKGYTGRGIIIGI